jgi:hypothetical protein
MMPMTSLDRVTQMALAYSAPNDKRPPINTSLWRYMSVSKLIQMLESRSIWFSRVDSLIKADPFEGTIPLRYAAIELTDEQRAKDAAYEEKHHFAPGSRAQMRATRLEMHRVERERTYVSCWHASQSDSDAMWRLYGADTDGSICVQTTAARAFEQLPPWVRIGRINYKAYDTEVFATDNAFSPFFHKRSCFGHENEVRFLINPSLDSMGSPWDPNAPGILVPFDPDELLIRICVSPASAGWFLETIMATVKRFGIKVPIEPAPMSMLPAFS